MQRKSSRILDKIPHKKPFRFADSISKVEDDEIIGSCFLDEDSFYYKGHFPENPITPGYIITETMAQIGILGLGIHLTYEYLNTISYAFLTTTDVKFYKVSYPNDTIKVISKKIFFRHNKLKCHIEAFNQKNELLCSGVFSGVIK